VNDLHDNSTGVRRPRSRWLWLAVPVALVVAGATVVALVVLRDPADTLSVDEAITRFRDRDAGDLAGAPPGGEAPRTGVYRFATTGSEGVDALNGSEHRYPAETTMTLSAAADDCLSVRWDALVQRWDDERLCPEDEGAGGWSRPATTLFHSFFNRDETRSYTCDGDPFVPPPAAEAGDQLAWTCASEGSGQSGDSHEAGTGEVVGVDTVEVGGRSRQALRVRYETEVSGETTGGGTTERWYALERYPLVLREVKRETTTSQTVIGTVNYREDYELVLRAWDPQR
jgi:hypothetical protein